MKPSRSLPATRYAPSAGGKTMGKMIWMLRTCVADRTGLLASQRLDETSTCLARLIRNSSIGFVHLCLRKSEVLVVVDFTCPNTLILYDLFMEDPFLA
jgi:hypothetical protein